MTPIDYIFPMLAFAYIVAVGLVLVSWWIKGE